MTVTNARKIEGYSDISTAALAQSSIINSISRSDIIGTPGTTTVKVYVNELATIADYTPGTGIAVTDDGSSYVTINNLKEKGINELLDGVTIETAPRDYVIKRLDAAMKAKGQQVDIDGFAKMVADGNELVASTGAKPTASTIYDDLAAAAEKLDEANAPQANRFVVITPEMKRILTSVDSKIVLDTDKGDQILADAWIGKVGTFNVFMSTLLPAGTNFIAGHKDAFVFADAFKREVLLQSLDGSGTYIGDSAIQGRWAYVTGAVLPDLLQINNGAA